MLSMKAPLEWNHGARVYLDEKVYVHNNENISIYNDVTNFLKEKMEDYQMEFKKYLAEAKRKKQIK